MHSDIAPGATFPDDELPDQTDTFHGWNKRALPGTRVP
jgi:hypothetical protein